MLLNMNKKNVVSKMIQIMGDDPNREGLLDTPKRVIKAWEELFSGYKESPQKILSSQFSEKIPQEGFIYLKNIEFFSTCVAGSTFVETPKGRIPIERLKDGEWIYCWDEDEDKITVAKARNPRVTGIKQQLWRIVSDKDTILCTGTHKFLTYNRGWVEAYSLMAGDHIVALNKGNQMQKGGCRSTLVWTGKQKAVMEHRYIYEQIHGNITRGYHIHHRDHNFNNNDPENLQCLSGSVHSRNHRIHENGCTGFAHFTEQQRKDMREKQIEGIIRSQTEDVRKKRSKSVKKYWDGLTPEQKADRNHCVLLVEKTDWWEDVWCMDVPHYHNFVANGMVVHNCEHHLLPFYGKAHIGYIPAPGGKVVGISKIARLLNCFAKRLQIQERIAEQITSSMMEELGCLGAICIIEAKHLCIACRGVEKQDSIMGCCSIKGIFYKDTDAKMEAIHLLKG